MSHYCFITTWILIAVSKIGTECFILDENVYFSSTLVFKISYFTKKISVFGLPWIKLEWGFCRSKKISVSLSLGIFTQVLPFELFPYLSQNPIPSIFDTRNTVSLKNASTLCLTITRLFLEVNLFNVTSIKYKFIKSEKIDLPIEKIKYKAFYLNYLKHDWQVNFDIRFGRFRKNTATLLI